MKQVICMKWGTLYGSEYVNRLYAMVRRRVSGDLRFVCLTDDRNGIRDEVECLDCPTVPIDMPYALHGWRKVSLFATSDRLFGLEGDWLYLDLDVVVTGSLDPFFTYRPEASFIVMQNWSQPGMRIGNTSVYRFKVGCAPFLLEKMSGDFHRYQQSYKNSQTFISREIGNDLLNFWPDEWCLLFKVNCVPSWPLRYWKEPAFPANCLVVAFPGKPNPDDAMDGKWGDKPQKQSFLNYKRIYKYIRPASWIRDLWFDAERHLDRAG